MVYFALGCPKEFRPRQAAEDDFIVDLQFSPCGGILLVLTRVSLQLWTGAQHWVCLHKLLVDNRHLEVEGHHLVACWRQTSQHIAVATSKSHIVIYQTVLPTFSPGGPNVLRLDPVDNAVHHADLSQRIGRQASVPLLYGVVCRLTSTAHHALVLTSLGYIVTIAWKTPDAVLQAIPSDAIARHIRFQPSDPANNTSQPGNIIDFCHEGRASLSAAVFTDGSVAILQTSMAKPEALEFSGFGSAPINATCVTLNVKHGLVAVGQTNSDVLIYRVTGTRSFEGAHVRLSLDTWAVPPAQLGHITAMHWTQDEEVICVGYQGLGLAVYHFTGPCVMSTVPKSSAYDETPPDVPSKQGIRAIAWDKEGYRLAVATTEAKTFAQFSFCKSIIARSPSQNTRGQIVLQAADRLLLFHMADSEFLPDNLEVVPVPSNYVAQSWPLQYVTISDDGQYIAIAGFRGGALYNMNLKKWRVFGDDQQETPIRCIAPLQWISSMVIMVPNFDASRRSFQLQFYPRYNLDRSSLLHEEPQEHQPIRLDTAPLAGNHNGIIIYDSAHVLTIYGVRLFADAVVTPTRVSMEIAPLHRVQMERSVPFPLSIRLLSTLGVHLPSGDSPTRGGKLAQQLPSCRVLLHRPTHVLSEYDPKTCREAIIIHDVDCFWADVFSLSANQLLLLTYNSKGVRLHSFTAIPSADMTSVALPSLIGTMQGGRSSYYFTMHLQDSDPETFPLGVLKGILVQGMEGLSSSLGYSTYPTYQVKTKPSLYSHGPLLGLVFQSSALSKESPTPTRRCASPIPTSETISPIAFPPATSCDGLSAFSDEIHPSSSLRPLVRAPSLESLHAPSEVSITPNQFGPPQATQKIYPQEAAFPHGSGLPLSSSAHLHALLPQDTREYLHDVMISIANNLKEGTSFPQCMEYLLHSVLHADDIYEKRPDYSRTEALRTSVEFLRRYHEYYDVIVGCIRKTDLNKWPILFEIVGSPLVIFDECIETGRVVTAAHLLRVLQLPMSMGYNQEKEPLDSEAEELQERAALTCAQEGARRLFPMALRSYQFQLAQELLRFVGLLTNEIASDLPPGRRRAEPMKLTRGGLPFISDGAQAILPNSDLDRIDRMESRNSMYHDPDDPFSPVSTPVHVLKADRLLRIQLETTACEMLARAELRHLTELFSIFQLDIYHFLRTHRSGCAKVPDLVSTFTNLHSDFNLPRCPEPLILPPSHKIPQLKTKTSGDETDHIKTQHTDDLHTAYRQHFLKYDMLYRQTLASIDELPDSDPSDLSTTIMDYAEFMTCTQVQLLVVPTAIGPMAKLQKAFEDCGCTEYALLLATVLLRVPTIVSLLQGDPTLFQPYVNLLCHKDNLGYCQLHKHLLAMYNAGALALPKPTSNPTTPISPHRLDLI